MHNNNNVTSSPQLTYSPQATKQRWKIVAILFVTLLVAYLDRVNVSVLVVDNAFLTVLGIKGDPVRIGMMMTSFLAAYALGNVLLSPLGDYLGPRKAMSLSIFLWSVALCVGGIASGFMMMMAARIMLGVGEAMHYPMQSAYVKNWFPPFERGKANSIWQFGIFVGPAIGMPFFTAIIQGTGWRGSFFVLAAIGMIPVLLLWFMTKDHPHQHKGVNKQELEYIEAGLAEEQRKEAEASSLKTTDAIKMFIGNYRYWILVIFYSSVCIIFWGSLAWLPTYLKVARGFSLSNMAYLSSLPYILGFIFILLFGYLTDKVGRRAPFAATSLLGSALGIYLGANAADNTSAAIWIAIGIAFIGMGLPSVWSLMQQVVPGKAIGAGAGVMNGVSNGVASLAPVIIGWLIAASGGSYMSGLMFLVGAGIVAALAMSILVMQRY